MLWLGLTLSIAVTVVSSRHELLNNPGFESPLAGHWEAKRFTISLSSDAHSGSHSLKSSERMRNIHLGPAQVINLERGKLYKFTCYVKQLNEMPGTLFQKYRANIVYDWSAGGQETVYIAYHTTVRSRDGWFRLSAYFRSPTQHFLLAKLRILGPDIGIEFLLDDCSLVKVNELANWRQEADNRIQQLRMGDIHLRFSLQTDLSADDFDVQIDHVKHHFGFGTLVRDRWMFDTRYRRYQNMVFNMFNTATTQGVKWLLDKGDGDDPDYDHAMTCVNILREHGMRVRAHNMFWGLEKNLPQFIYHMSASQLNTTVQKRLHHMMTITNGKADHWDVMNELLHGQWFEDKFSDPHFSQKVFREVHQLDRKPLLMLNDYSIINKPYCNDAYLQQAQRFLSQGVPLHALGLQGHFHTTAPDPSLTMLLLDHVAKAGLPLWVTELDVWHDDPNVRANYYEKLLRLFFSHPSIEGVVIWGFWDQHVVDSRSSLVDGNDMTINAAGKRFIHLTKEEWSTHVNRSLSSGTHFDVRGFKGDYKVVIRQNGRKIKEVPFSLTSNDTTVDINISSSDHVIPSTGSGNTGDPHHLGNHVIGTDSSSSSSHSLMCNHYRSAHSAIGAGESAEAKCIDDDEIMTGCSSVHQDHDWHRQGERIITDSGKIKCRAVDGHGTTGTVQAVAVCCKLSGLTCTYRSSDSSPTGRDTTVEAQCLHNETPFGIYSICRQF